MSKEMFDLLNKNLYIIVFLIVLMMYVYFFHSQLEKFQFVESPEINDGDQFMLMTIDGQYLSVCKGCKPYNANIKNMCESLLCLTRYPLQSSVFKYHSFLDGRFALETNEFKFWKHCDECVHECKGSICADGINKNLKTHKWILVKNADSDHSVSIKSNSGRMVQRCDCSQTCGSIMCTMGLSGSEKFKVIKVNDVKLKQPDFKYKPKRGRSSLFDGVSLSMFVG